MSRRPWFARDLYAALQRLRARLAALFSGRPSRRPDDPRARRATPEVRALEYRNPPSEAWGSTALPLAVTAAAAAAAVHSASRSAAADEARPGPRVDDGSGRPGAPLPAGGAGGGSGGDAPAAGPANGSGRVSGGAVVPDWSRPDPFAGLEEFRGTAGSVSTSVADADQPQAVDGGGADPGPPAGGADPGAGFSGPPFAPADDGDDGPVLDPGRGAVHPRTNPRDTNAPTAVASTTLTAGPTTVGPSSVPSVPSATPVPPVAAAVAPPAVSPAVPPVAATAPPVVPGVFALPQGVQDSRPLPDPQLFAASADSPVVRSYAGDTGAPIFTATVFGPGYAGGVSVAAGDIDHDAIPDAVVGASAGNPPLVAVLHGRTGDPVEGSLGTFLAFGPRVRGGVSVSAADVDGDGRVDVIAGAITPRGAVVRAFSGADGTRIAEFVVPGRAFAGGLSIAAADFDGDGRAEVAVAPTAGGGRVRVYEPLTGDVLDGRLGSFAPFGVGYRGGVLLGTSEVAGDVNADGTPDLAVGTASGPGRARVISGADAAVLRDVRVPGRPPGGVSVALSYADDDPFADLALAAAGVVLVYSGRTGAPLPGAARSYTPFGGRGLAVAASNDPPEVYVYSMTASVTEGTSDVITIYLGRTGSTASGLTAYYSLSGTATNGIDYVGNTTASFLSGDAVSEAVNLTLVNDDYDEGDETVILTVVTLGGGSDYDVGTPASGTATIVDDDGTSPPPPPAPAITALTTDTGASDSDRVTTDTTLTLSGTAAAGATVTVSDRLPGDAASTALGTTTASAGGTWSYDVPSAAAAGHHAYTASTTSSGVTTTSDDFVALIDTTAPELLLTTAGPALTYETRPALVVTAADTGGGFPSPGTVTLDADLNNDADFTDTGETGYATGTLANGAYVFTGYDALTPGTTVNFRARVTDLAGNEGTSPPLAVTVLPTPTGSPAAPVVTTVADDTGSGGSDRVTSDTTPTLSGTADPGVTVTVYRRGPADSTPVSIGTTTASGGGTWSFTVPAALADGGYIFTARATDGGVTSAGSNPVVVVVATAPPTVTLAAPPQTYLTTPPLVVTAADLAGFPSPATVTLDVDLNDDDDFSDSGEAGYATGTLADGVYVFDAYTAFTAGTTVNVRARVTGLSGIEATSDPASVQILSPPVPPTTPSAPVLGGLADDSGSSGSDRVTSDTTPTLSGTAPAGSTVTLYVWGPGDTAWSSAGTDTADGGGAWSITLASALDDGRHAFSATATVSGVTSAYADPLDAAIDTTAPTILATAFPTLTYDPTPPVAVTALDLVGFPSPATVTLDADLNDDGDFSDSGESGYATGTLANGAYVFDGYTPIAADTTVRFRARATDLAGNAGVSSAVTVTVLAPVTAWDTLDLTAADRGGYGGLWGWFTAEDSLLHGGDVTAEHPLDLDVSVVACGCQEPSLRYHSQEAAPVPVVQAAVRSDNALPVPDHVYGTLTWDGVGGSTTDYDLSELSPGADWLFAASPGGSPATGRHTYTLDLFLDYPGTDDDLPLSVSGATFVVNRSTSPYGAGWSFSNTDTLVTIAADGTHPAGVLRLFGKGGWGFYADAGGGTYDAPPGDGGELLAVGGGWEYTTTAGAVLGFDSSGQLTTWTSPDTEEVLTYTYDGSGGVATMAGPDGGVATFAYSSGRLATITAPGNRVTTLTYSGDDLVGIQDPGGTGLHTLTYSGHRLTCDQSGPEKVSYAYDAHGLPASFTLGADPLVTPAVAAGLLVGTDAATLPGGGVGVPATYVDALGHKWLSWYDALGQVVRTRDPIGAVRTYARDDDGYLTRFTDALGRTTTYAVDDAGRVTGTTRPDGSAAAWVYGGANGSLTRFTDFGGGVWTYTNDAFGRRLTATDPLNHTTTFAYDDGLLTTITDALGQVVTLLYDGARRPTGSLVGGAVTGTVGYDSAGNPAVFTDPLGHVSTATYDPAGRMTAWTDPLGHATTFAYAGKHSLLSTTDPIGRTTSFGYDDAGRVTTRIRGFGSFFVESRATAVYDAAGQVIASVDPLGNRTTSVYDPAGRVVAVVDPLGNRTTFGYDLEGQLTSVRDPLNRVTQFHHDLLGRVDAVTDPLGRTTTTVYDPDSNVVAVIDPLGHRVTSVYDDANRVVAVVDPLGNRTSFGYDAVDRLVSVTDPLGNTTTTAYDVRGNVASVEDALGNRTTFGYDVADNRTSVTDPLGRVTTLVHDVLNRVVAVVDPLGNRATSVYDAAGQVVATIDALGNRATTVYDDLGRAAEWVDALGNRTTAVYDLADRLTAVVDANGNRTTSVYDTASRLIATVDALGNRTTRGYDAAGQMTSVIDPLGNRTTLGYDGLGRPAVTTDPLGHTWTTGHDAAGRVVSSTDPLGRRTTFVYDDADRLVATVDALGNRTTTVYDDAGNAIASVDPLGRRTTFVYDELNRAVAHVDALGNRATSVYDAAGQVASTVDALGRTTSYGYDLAGRHITTTDALGGVWTTAFDAAGNPVASTDPLGRTTTAVYDALNRGVASVDALGNRATTTFDPAGNVRTVQDPLGRTTTFAYDALNRPVSTTDALGNLWTTAYDAAGRPVGRIDPLGNRVTTVYDAASRPVASVDPLGNRTTAVYNAANELVATVDPLGNRTTRVYDAAGRPVASIDPLGNRVTTVYDDVGNVTALTDPLGNTTTWTYDVLNRVTAETDPTGASTTFAHDAVGRLVSRTDRLGRRRDFGYDDLDRMTTEKWYASGGSLTQTQTWSYDAVGQVLTVADPDGTYTMGYDGAGRVSSVQQPFGLVLTFTHDAVGNRTAVQDSLGGVTTVTFDALNRQTGEEVGGSGLTPVKETRAFTAAGQLSLETRQTWSGSVWATAGTTSYAYDDASRVTGITHFTGLGMVLASYAYDYDDASRLTAETVNGSLRTFAYDQRSQLTGDGGTTFGYDANGNRNTSGYSTGTANRMTTDGVWTLTYDAEGNVTKRSQGGSADTWEYGYDHENRLVWAAFSATDGGTVTQRVTMAYDGFGNEIQRQAWDGTTTTTERYGQDGWDPAKPMPRGNENFDPWVDLDGSNALVTRRVFGPGFDEPGVRFDSSGDPDWYLKDRLGSVRGITDDGGTPLTTLAYDGWGTVVSDSTPAESDRFRYTSAEWDAVLGLRQHGDTRFTDGNRWLSEDPLGFAAGDPNLYRYVGNGPTNATDPSGRQPPSKDEVELILYELRERYRFAAHVLPDGKIHIATGNFGIGSTMSVAEVKLRMKQVNFFAALPGQPVAPNLAPPPQNLLGTTGSGALGGGIPSGGARAHTVFGQSNVQGGLVIPGRPSAAPWLFGFIGGSGAEFWDGVVGTINALANPIETGEALLALADPKVWPEILAALKHELKEDVDKAANGCGEAAGRLTVKLAPVGALAVFGPAKILRIARWARGGKVGPNPGLELPPGHGKPPKVEVPSPNQHATPPQPPPNPSNGGNGIKGGTGNTPPGSTPAAPAAVPRPAKLPAAPDQLTKLHGYNEVSDPRAAALGYRRFENPATGDIIEFHKGKPGATGFEGIDHYHRYNPNSTSKLDFYLDKHGKPCPKGSRESHILPEE